MVAPRGMTRELLAKALGNDQRLIIAFENLLQQAGETLPAAVEEAMLAAENAAASAASTQGLLERIATAVETLALAPAAVQMAEGDVAPAAAQVAEDDVRPPAREYIDEAAFGEFYVSNGSEVVAVAAINTPYEVTGGMLAGETFLTTFGGDHYLQVDRGGFYRVCWSLSMDTAAGADEIEGGIMVNGTASEKGTAHTTVAAASDASTTAGSAIFNLAALDQLSLYVRNHTGTRDITVEHASLTAVLIRRLA